MTTNKKSLGFYLHIPFCAQKCLYCDFLSFDRISEETQETYCKSLQKEIEHCGRVYGNKYTVNSIFVGGGTPSLLDPEHLYSLITEVRQQFALDKEPEITLEANPGTLSPEKLERYWQMGINRISMGAQSFDDEVLQHLGRMHRASDLVENFRSARACGFRNINLDLMFGIPGQTLESWQDTLEQAVSLGPEHISFYSLQLEEGTPFFEMFERGQLHELPEDIDREMYHIATEMLIRAGYDHYEISNAAKPGFACRHNLKYWSMKDYLGLGLGAHSFMGGERFSNRTDLEEYQMASAEDKVCWRHVNSRRDSMSEYLFTGLRKRKGIDLADFERRFGETIQSVYREVWPKIQGHIDNGNLALEEGRLRLTVPGIDISNGILCEFV